MLPIDDGFVIVCKRDCPTCVLIEPAMVEIARASNKLTIYTQDDPAFPAGVPDVLYDQELENSFQLDIEIVPTLIQVQNGEEVARTIGWNRTEWRAMTGLAGLGAELPEQKPGCGSKSVEPGIAERLVTKFGQTGIQARQIDLASLEDEIEACFDRDWSDGLPVVPPTPERVLRMLQGTSRQPDEIVGVIPPNQVACSVEKVAINAVMAGCKPEYLPVVLAAVEAACIDAFCMHGVLATTWFSGPVVIVNGPVTKAIGMNSGVNAFGQGNRANATIGRALQLVIRNVGGGKPGRIDRSCMGNPGKYTFCFAENEEESPWESLSVERGFAEGTSTVTLFAGDGVQGISDQNSRTPESLAQSLAASLRTVGHANVVMASDAILAISPEHGRIFREAGWSKDRLRQELTELLTFPADEMSTRFKKRTNEVGDSTENSPGPQTKQGRTTVTKFRPSGLHIVHVGGRAGLFSAIIAGWLGSGPKGSSAVTHQIVF
ncbi:thioredoxin family protein [Chloroflexi bacterium TSY]|nr:thioredoxin family protein [Chloroflexi bacterium TSY]